MPGMFAGCTSSVSSLSVVRQGFENSKAEFAPRCKIKAEGQNQRRSLFLSATMGIRSHHSRNTKTDATSRIPYVRLACCSLECTDNAGIVRYMLCTAAKTADGIILVGRNARLMLISTFTTAVCRQRTLNRGGASVPPTTYVSRSTPVLRVLYCTGMLYS